MPLELIKPIYAANGHLSQSLRAFGRPYRYTKEQEDYARQIAQTLGLGNEKTNVLLANASAGIGKSLGYLISAAIVAAQTQRQVVISTGTIKLQQQLLGEQDLLDNLMDRIELPRQRIALRIGRRNFIWPERTLTALEGLEHQHRLEGGSTSHSPEFLQDQRTSRDNLRAAAEQLLEARANANLDVFDQPSTFQIYREIYGDLPLGLTEADICVRPSTPDGEAWLYLRHADLGHAADIQVVNHAFLASSAKSNMKSLRPEGGALTHLIVDEADLLPDAAKHFALHSLPLYEVRALFRESRDPDLANWHEEATDFFKRQEEQASDEGKGVWTRPIIIDPHSSIDPVSAEAVVLAERLRAITAKIVKRKSETARSRAIAEDIKDQIAEWLSAAKVNTVAKENRDAGRISYLRWTPRRQQPSFGAMDGTSALLLSRFWSNDREDDQGAITRNVVLTSATLGKPLDPDRLTPSERLARQGADPLARSYDAMLGKLGLKKRRRVSPESIKIREFEPSHYGEIKQIYVAQSNAPRCFIKEDEELYLNPDYVDHVVEFVEAAALHEHQNILLLSPAFHDLEVLEPILNGRLSDRDLFFTRRGVKPSQVVADWSVAARQGRPTLLAAPNLWQGFDAPYLIDAIVFSRMPIPRKNDEDVKIFKMRRERLRRIDPTYYSPEADDQKAAEGAIRSEALSVMMRMLEQGLSRGMRAPDDAVTLYVPDRRGTTGDQFRLSLPQRFRNGPNSAWGRRKILATLASARGADAAE